MKVFISHKQEDSAQALLIQQAFTKNGISAYLGQYRTKIVPQMRCRFFRQIVLKYRRNTDVFQGILVQYDGKRSSRCGAKPQGGLCAVLP